MKSQIIREHIHIIEQSNKFLFLFIIILQVYVTIFIYILIKMTGFFL